MDPAKIVWTALEVAELLTRLDDVHGNSRSSQLARQWYPGRLPDEGKAMLDARQAALERTKGDEG